MPKEIKFEIPEWSWDDETNANELLTMGRGKARTFNHPHIIMTVLRKLKGQMPTRDQLQKFSRIRRKRFIVVLKHLLDTGSVTRVGEGTKFSPYLYALGEKERHR